MEKSRIGKKLALLLRALPKIIEVALKERFHEIDEWEFFHVEDRDRASSSREESAKNASLEERGVQEMHQSDWLFEDYLCAASIFWNGHTQVRARIGIEEWFAIGAAPVINVALWIRLPDETLIRKEFRYDSQDGDIHEETDPEIPENPPTEIPFTKPRPSWRG